MSNFFHTNISFNVRDKKELYEIWDKDLIKTNKKRNRWMWILGISTLFILFGDTVLLKVSFVGVSLFASVMVLTYFIDESNINYLMHKIDIDDVNFSRE
jgi:hypothetical protein